MSERSLSELHATLGTFRSLLVSRAETEARLLTRRTLATAAAAAQIDHLLAINQQTMEAIRRAIPSLEEQIQALERLESAALPH